MEILRSLAERIYTAFSVARKDEEGQAMVEYALIIFLVSIVSIAVLPCWARRFPRSSARLSPTSSATGGLHERGSPWDSVAALAPPLSP